MILPTTYQSALLLLVLSMVCWGSWANAFKLTGPKWRFELFSYDYAIGVLIASLVAAYTLGSLGSDLNFSDQLYVTGQRNQAFIFAGGVIFAIANTLLMAAISVAGMSVAFPVGIGLALVVGVTLNYVLNPQGNPYLLFGGILLVVLAIIADSRAYRLKDRDQKSAAREARQAKAAVDKVEKEKAAAAAAELGSAGGVVAKAQAPKPSPRGSVEQPKKPKKTVAQGILLSLAAGLLMGFFYPLVSIGMMGEFGAGAYGAAVVFSIGVFASTLVCNFVFLNIHLIGDPISIRNYFSGTLGQHLLGILGGIIWAVGGLSNFAAATAPESIQVGPAISLAMGQCATLISVLWGLFVWKEFKGASKSVIWTIVLMILLFMGGLALLSLAPIVRF
jgi:glucose uptake protein